MLTSRQAAFVVEIVRGLTATEAAKRAGYRCSGGNQAARLMRSPKVQAAIIREREKLAARVGRSRAEWLRDLVNRQEQAAGVEQFGPVSSMLATEGKALGFLSDAPIVTQPVQVRIVEVHLGPGGEVERQVVVGGGDEQRALPAQVVVDVGGEENTE